ncbi:MAG TPA: OsmC family protein [Myxococcota bacterium]|nr:OsmC family protein [Myxococcota bacterium]
MSEHQAIVSWERRSIDFSYDSYPRDHSWDFGHGLRVEASAAPDFHGDPAKVDPERALVAAVSSCHMLTFLAIAARRRLVVDSYTDSAVGYLEKNDAGKLCITRVALHPEIVFAGDTAPSASELDKLHHLAHENCFIANSVRAAVSVEKR